MKFTVGWLRDHLDTTAGVAEIADRLTAVGLEVEGVTDRGAALDGFVVAHVVEARPHPNADRLRLCTVDTGTERLQVVCGAPNARAGLRGVFAPVGSVIPASGTRLVAAKIRGEASNGMLCSERELGLGEDHAGIIELAEDAVLGTPAAAALGVDDPVIEIAITPNRQDCLGVRGIARDLAAAGLGNLKPRPIPRVPGRFASALAVRLDFAPGTESACPLFVGRYVRNVTNGPSPRWLQDRLRAIGLRPISALVDMTNYLTFDLGRPLHVFDAETVAGGIHVRLSRPGETLVALNGRDYTTDDAMTVIADDDGVLALGGIMGGTPSGCTAETRNVFIEAALFDPLRTAQTGRKLQIESDARYRFERGVDPGFVVDGMEAATALLIELCGGEPSELVVAGAAPDTARDVRLRASRVRSLGGLELPEAEIERILRALGFGVERLGPELRVSVPSWRRDIDGEADLVEEVVRIHGYDAIPAVPPERVATVTRPAVAGAQQRRRLVRRTLAARGLVEAVTYSFTSGTDAGLFGGGQAALRLANPISADLDVMRPSLLPNLLAAAARNHARGFAATALFEVGPTYAGVAPGDQAMVAGGVRTGEAAPRHWQGERRDWDLFDAKADALAALVAAGAPEGALAAVAEPPAWYHPGRSGALKLGGGGPALAWFGELHPAIAQRFDLRGGAVAFEVVLDRVPAPKAKAGRNRAKLVLNDYPSVERDFAFLVDAEVASGAIVRAARQADRDLIADAGVFDVYAGEGIPAGKKSVALAVRLAPADRTLTDAEIEAVAAKVVVAVAKATGGSLRG